MLVVFLVCEVHINPFRLEVVNILQSIIDMILIFVLVGGILMSTDFITSDTKDHISTFVVVIVLIGVVIALGTIVVEIRLHLQVAPRFLSDRFVVLCCFGSLEHEMPVILSVGTSRLRVFADDPRNQTQRSNCQCHRRHEPCNAQNLLACLGCKYGRVQQGAVAVACSVS